LAKISVSFYVQGNSKTESIFFLCFYQNEAKLLNFVYLNFCLCMIVPKSFSNPLHKSFAQKFPP